MPPSLTGTSKRTLARIQRLCCLGVNSEVLVPELIQELTNAIPSGGGWFFWVAPGEGFVNSYATFPLSIMERYFRDFYRTHCETEVLGDVTAWPATSGVSTKHVIPRKALLRSEYYNELWRAAGVHEFISLTVQEGSHERVGFTFIARLGSRTSNTKT
jgi:hypothetical protein